MAIKLADTFSIWYFISINDPKVQLLDNLQKHQNNESIVYLKCSWILYGSQLAKMKK